MKKRLFLLCLLFPSLASQSRSTFSAERKSALEWLQKKIIEQSIEFSFDPQINQTALAIVAPELIRYQLFRDFLETKALEQWYVEGGSEAADFSIGPFQMKPSFIEALENHLRDTPELKDRFPDLVIDPRLEARTARALRIKRMKQFDCQIKYVFCFYFVVTNCYNDWMTQDPEAQLRFYATAYNYGFDRPLPEIESWLTKTAFPYGQKLKLPQLAYADLAWAFYQDFAHHPEWRDLLTPKI